MTDSLSQYCPNCEAQANTIEELRAANERWAIAFKLAEERAKTIEAVRDRMAELTAAIQKEWGAGSQQHYIGRDFMDIIDAFEKERSDGSR